MTFYSTDMRNSQVPKKTETLRKCFYLSAIYPFGNIFSYSLFISLMKVYELCINVFELYNGNVFGKNWTEKKGQVLGQIGSIR